MIRNQADFDAFLEAILQEDILEWARQQRQNTKWIVVCVTNMTIFVNKINDHPIGNNTVNLPEFVKNNRGIIGLEKDCKGHQAYNDNLCFFRALAIQRGLSQEPISIFESGVRELFNDLVRGDATKYEGIQLHDLPSIEKKLQLNINVLQLEKKEDGQVLAKMTQRSLCRYPETMNLNLYENHFSLISNLDHYSYSYECPCCRKLWKKSFLLHRHMKTCTNVTKWRFIGGTYEPEMTVFELLEDEGIHVDAGQQFYPYRITYDYECFFDQQDLPT